MNLVGAYKKRPKVRGIVAGSTGRQEVARSGSAMSALGQKQTSEHVQSMSALLPKADIGTGPRITFGATVPATWDVRRDLPPAGAALKLRFTRTMRPPHSVIQLKAFSYSAEGADVWD